MENLAKSDLNSIDQEDIVIVKNWWSSWYLKIGHRRLGRALLRSGTQSAKSRGVTQGRDNPNVREPSSNSEIKVEIDERYEIRSSELYDGTIFGCYSYPPKTSIVLNQLHPMHDQFFRQVKSELSRNDNENQPLISLLIAWAEVELSYTSDSTKERIEQIRYDISRVAKSGRTPNNVAII
jgi:hypothetical protein